MTRRVHAWVFSGITALATAAHALVPVTPSFGIQVAVLCVLVAVIGLPHGAMDPVIARRGGLFQTIPGLLLFLFAYTVTAGLVVAVWWAAPELSLAVFLALSAYHFGGDWADELSPRQRALAGTLVMGAPATFHPDEVAGLFSALVPEAGAIVIAHALAVSAVMAACLLLLGARAAFARPVRPRRAAIELLTATAAGAILPPLAAFALYFCGLHGPRHLMNCARTLGATYAPSVWRSALPLTLLTVMAAVAAHGLLSASETGMPEHGSVIAVVFIGLAALTVPHMLIVDVLLPHGLNRSAAARTQRQCSRRSTVLGSHKDWEKDEGTA